jgi:hypothetical protein
MKIKLALYFYFCWLFIGAVSSLDVYLTIRFSDNLEEYELNPIARLILQADDWEVSRFVAIKVFLTILVLGIMRWILYLNQKFAITIISVIAFLQAILLGFLLLSW